MMEYQELQICIFKYYKKEELGKYTWKASVAF